MSIDKPNITYLLGAGASFLSQPLVSEITDELTKMLNYMDEYEQHVMMRTGHKKYLEHCRELIKEVKEHSSIDTLARKLWLKKQKDISYEIKYIRIKNLLTCMFLFRNINTFHKKISTPDFEMESPLESTRRSHKIDPRYEAFFASLLTKDFQIPTNITILTWNYDFQIEKAFQFYFNGLNFEEIGTRLGINITDWEKELANVQLVKLNGTALMYDSDNLVILEEYNDEAHKIFWRALNNDFDVKLTSKIKFAWEEDSKINGKDFREIASTIIAYSKNVVVIGYSFPVFNREVDMLIFKDFILDNSHRVFIQAPPGKAQLYIEQLNSIKDGLSNHAEAKTNTEQFYIPPLQWIKEPDNFL